MRLNDYFNAERRPGPRLDARDVLRLSSWGTVKVFSCYVLALLFFTGFIDLADKYLSWGATVAWMNLAVLVIIPAGYFLFYHSQARAGKEKQYFIDHYPRFASLGSLMTIIIISGIIAALFVIIRGLTGDWEVSTRDWAHIGFFCVILVTTVLFYFAFKLGIKSEHSGDSGRRPQWSPEVEQEEQNIVQEQISLVKNRIFELQKGWIKDDEVQEIDPEELKKMGWNPDGKCLKCDGKKSIRDDHSPTGWKNCSQCYPYGRIRFKEEQDLKSWLENNKELQRLQSDQDGLQAGVEKQMEVEFNFPWLSSAASLSGQSLKVNYTTGVNQFDYFRRLNEKNFIANEGDMTKEMREWGNIYVASKESNKYSREIKELAFNLYKYVEKHDLSEYQQVELFLAAVQKCVDYSKDEESAPEINIPKPAEVVPINYPKIDRLKSVVYLFWEVTDLSTDELMTDDEEGFIIGKIKEWEDNLDPAEDDEEKVDLEEMRKFLDNLKKNRREGDITDLEWAPEGGFIEVLEEGLPHRQHAWLIDDLRELIDLSEDNVEKFTENTKRVDEIEHKFNIIDELRQDVETFRPSDYPRYPTETLHEQTGDCEDGAIVLAALLRECGFEVCLFYLESTTDSSGSAHMACGVKIEGSHGPRAFAFVDSRHKDWVYCETTSEGWKAGQMPKEWRIKGDPIEVPKPTARPQEYFAL